MKNIKNTSIINNKITQPMVKIFILLIFILITCSNKPSTDLHLAEIGFYSSPEEQITLLGKEIPGYRESFILGHAYKKLKKYKRAAYYFANSFFKDHRFIQQKHTINDIIEFIKTDKKKSEYFYDTLYEMAEIYSLYNNLSVVIELLNPIKQEQSGLYLNSLLLKANTLVKMKMFDQGIVLLEESLKIFDQNDSKLLILLKISNLYEKRKLYDKAIDNYITIIMIDPQSWHSTIASKQIIQILQNKQIKLQEDKKKFYLMRTLYNNKDYINAFKISEEINYQNNFDTDEFLKTYIRILSRLNNFDAIKLLLQSSKKNIPLYHELLFNRADELWKMRKKDISIPLFKEIIQSNIEPFAEISLKQLCNFFAENYTNKYQGYFLEYIKKYKKNSSTGYFLWILARDELLNNNYEKAKSYLLESINNFPKGYYSDLCRYWLFKIHKNKKDEKNADRLAKEIITFNPESSYSWDILYKIESEYSIISLEKMFNASISSQSYDEALFYHSILYVKDKNITNREKRIKYINLPIIEKYNNFKKNLNPDNADIINSIEKYFAIGNIDYIERELLKFNGTVESKIKRNLTLAIFGHKYNHPYLAARSLNNLLKLKSLPEIIQLMPIELLNHLYPLAFKNCIDKIEKQYSLNKNIIYSVMRSESLYKHTAVSHSNAIGLMQLLPSTAAGISKSLKKSNFNLKNPCTSIQFGTIYLSWLYDSFNKNISLTLAGYNAGPNYIKRAFKQNRFSDFDLFLESIPMIETRLYIIRTNKFIHTYGLIYDN